MVIWRWYEDDMKMIWWWWWWWMTTSHRWPGQGVQSDFQLRWRSPQSQLCPTLETCSRGVSVRLLVEKDIFKMMMMIVWISYIPLEGVPHIKSHLTTGKVTWKKKCKKRVWIKIKNVLGNLHLFAACLFLLLPDLQFFAKPWIGQNI